MKPAAILFAMVLLIASGASAQAEPQTFSLFASPTQQTFAAAIHTESAPLFAFESPEMTAAAPALFSVPAANLLAMSSPVPQGNPGVIGVYPDYNFQLYVGYTFLRFYKFPGKEVTLNGLDIDMTYYPGGGVIGPEGNLTVGFGTDMNECAKLAAGMGGVRYRRLEPRAVELWVHGLMGVSHYLPQTAYGGQSSFGYEAGGGIDIRAHHARFAYRFEADMLGTRFFHTYQYSPKLTAGIVFKF